MPRSLPAFRSTAVPTRWPQVDCGHPPRPTVRRPSSPHTPVARAYGTGRHVERCRRRSVLPELADWLPRPKARLPLIVLVLRAGLPSCRRSRCNTARHHRSRPCKGSAHGCRGRPIPDMQLASTMSAPQQPDQKTRAIANRRHRFVPLRVHQIAPYHSLVLFIGRPVNITYMMITDEDAALFGGAHRALTFLEPAAHQRGRYRTPSPNIGTGIEGIAQNIAD